MWRTDHLNSATTLLLALLLFVATTTDQTPDQDDDTVVIEAPPDHLVREYRSIATLQDDLEDEEELLVVGEEEDEPRDKRQFVGWPPVLPVGPCFTSKGVLGRCTSFRQCYPYFKLPELSNWETWILGVYDTCSYFTPSGRQMFGVCCTNPVTVRPTQPPRPTPPPTPSPPLPPEEVRPVEGGTGGGVPSPNPVPPNWPPPIPTHPPDHTIPPLPTHPPSPGWPGLPEVPSTEAPATQPTTTKPPRPPGQPWPPQPWPPATTKPPSTPMPWPPTAPTAPTHPPMPTHPPLPTHPPIPTHPPLATQPPAPPVPTTDAGPAAIGDASCGIKTRTSEPDQERIVGGHNADLGEWPWIAALFNGGRQFCGGSLIDSTHILTAAHCVAHMSSWDVARLTVRLGDYNIKTNTEVRHIEKKVKRVVRHRGFDSRTLYNDIALLTLDSPVTFTKQVRPICLPSGNAAYAGVTATVIGWGSLRESGPQPAVLQEVSISIWTNQECRAKYGNAAPGGIVEHFLCAGQAGKDSCSGDSGGPLMINEGRWTQVGIVSWGIGCGKGQYPGVYTRVTHFMSWISKNLK